MTGHDPPRRSDLPPGYDEEDPYEGEDLDEYPDWWRRNIRLFREHGLRPYRPSRFTDGKIVPQVIDELEAAHDVDIRIKVHNPRRGTEWMVLVDDEPVSTVSRERMGEGYTEYKLSSDELVSLVQRAVD